MYIRRVKTRAKGVDYFSYKLVENKRINGVPKQINLLSLGKLDGFSNTEIKLLNKRIGQLYTHQSELFPQDYPKKVEEISHFFIKKLIQKKFNNYQESEVAHQENPVEKNFVEVDINSTIEKESQQIGGEFLCNQAIKELGLDTFLLEELSFTPTQLYHSLLELTGKLLYPTSENRTAHWLNENSAAIDFYPLESGKVNKNQLYSAAKQLYTYKEKIENHLNITTEKIFDLNRKIVLYDLTNTHFEGQMKGSEKAAFGRNKQKRYDCRQITMGMLTDENGFPIHTRYYEGNVSEPGTLKKILNDLLDLHANLFTNTKPCIIMDAGIATDDNVRLLLKKGYEYICVSRSQHKDFVNKVKETELIKFKNKSDKELSAQLFTQEFEYKDDKEELRTITERLVYIKSPDKQQKEKSIDEKKCSSFEQGLKKIEKTINNPRGMRKIAQINQRLGRLKEQNKGITQFFDIEIKNDTKNIVSISWKRNQHIPKEKKQGVYFLRTNIAEQSEEKLWNLYRLENEVEEAFGILKSDLNVRPNFHHKDTTIEAHINMSVLAYYIVSFIRYRLKTKNIDVSWSEICRIMSSQKRTIQVSRIKSAKALWTKTCTVPNTKAKEIFDAMGYKTIPYYRKSFII